MKIMPTTCFPSCWPTDGNSDRKSINSKQSSADRFEVEDESSCFDCFSKDSNDTQNIKNGQDEYVKGLLSADDDSDDGRGDIIDGYGPGNTIPKPLSGHDPTL